MTACITTAPAAVDYTAVFRGAHRAVIDATNRLAAADRPMSVATVSALYLASTFLDELADAAAAGTLCQTEPT